MLGVGSSVSTVTFLGTETSVCATSRSSPLKARSPKGLLVSHGFPFRWVRPTHLSQMHETKASPDAAAKITNAGSEDLTSPYIFSFSTSSCFSIGRLMVRFICLRSDVMNASWARLVW